MTFKFKINSTLFIMLTLTLSIASCSGSDKEKDNVNGSNPYVELEKASWLIGTWQNNSSEGSSTEIWRKENDSTYVGESYFVIESDTVSYEEFTLTQIGGRLSFTPTVRNQNNNKPVKFDLTSMMNKQLVFENLKHDFPQQISYTQINGDSLLAQISGVVDGKLQSMKFPMSRIK
ncbi:MAG: hypothetical protein COA38_10970 [Fluviicola sp.]|nr:MAG: hypothetical protein COA38_10970 [Fluviicola sp.]